MAALLVAIGVMAVMLTAAMPAWRQLVQREKEEELIFRGQQYVRAIGLFQRQSGVTYPPNIDVLVKQRFLRKKYKDPMTEDGEFQLLYQGRITPAQRLTQAGPLASRGQGPGPGVPFGGSLPGSTSTPFAQPTGRGGMGTGPGAGSGAGQGIRAGGALGAGGIIGVVSKSTAKSIRLYNGRNFYNEWEFIYLAASARPGVGVQVPGQMRAPGQQQGPFGPGRGQRGFGPGVQQDGQRGPAGPGGATRPRNPGGGPGN